ncbi:MAG TPA: hypothetical protein PKO09_11565 [Anaerolineae bacterium]|nr:hypothetical protein [Anaerolineae bacterium]
MAQSLSSATAGASGCLLGRCVAFCPKEQGVLHLAGVWGYMVKVAGMPPAGG